MAPSLREQFDRAVADDPGVPPGEMAQAAIAAGGALRRKRRLLTATAAAAAAIGVLAGANVLLRAPQEPQITVAAAFQPVAAPACVRKPVEHDATDIVVFLRSDATDRQRDAIAAALDADAAVSAKIFENREQAYERFRALWADSPDFVASVGPDSLPEDFRVRLAAPADVSAVRSRLATLDGIQDIMGRRCQPDAPIGGVL
jgi:cell division transport system permease protein